MGARGLRRNGPSDTALFALNNCQLIPLEHETPNLE